LSAIKDAWPAVLEEIKNIRRRVAAYLSPSRPLSFDGHELVVEVQAKFHRDTMSKDDHRSVFADGLHSALGIRPDVSFVARGAEEEGSPAPAPETGGDIAELAEAEPIDASATDPVELVKRGLGAEVVEEMKE
jgi:hypothetical protein